VSALALLAGLLFLAGEVFIGHRSVLIAWGAPQRERARQRCLSQAVPDGYRLRRRPKPVVAKRRSGGKNISRLLSKPGPVDIRKPLSLRALLGATQRVGCLRSRPGPASVHKRVSDKRSSTGRFPTGRTGAEH
jgi:hypothetical protein